MDQVYMFMISSSYRHSVDSPLTVKLMVFVIYIFSPCSYPKFWALFAFTLCFNCITLTLCYSEILIIVAKVFSHPAHGNSKCCTVGNWTCFLIIIVILCSLVEQTIKCDLNPETATSK